MKNLRNLNELLQRIKKILKKIKESDTVCVIHHDDADGNCSAALFSILVHDLIGDYPILFPIRGENNVNKRMINQLKILNPDYVFVFDMTVNPKKLNMFKGFVLDHHVFQDIVQREGMSYLNPRSFEEEEDKIVPVSYMTYRILSDLFQDEKVAWIAGIGITEDHRVDLCKGVFEKIREENPELLGIDTIDQATLEKSVFGQFWDMVRSGRMVRKVEGARTAVLALIECKDRPDKFMNGLTQHSFALRKFYDKVSYETQDCLMDVKKTGKFYSKEKVIVYKAKRSRISALTSYIADKIRQEYPEWIVCVIGREHGMEKKKISIRLEQTKRKEDLVSILEKIKENIPSIKGGGHNSAVGVSVNSNYVDDFFQEFLALIK